TPAQRLDRDLQVRREAHRVHDVPAVEAEALLRAVDAVRPDHLGQAGVGAVELLVGRLAVALLLHAAGIEVVGAAEVVLGAGAADGREDAVPIHEELDLALAPPAGVVDAPGHVGPDEVALAL